MVLGLFSKERALQKNIEKATAKHAQSLDRRAAMEKLVKNGSDDAFYGLCKRFSLNYDKSIEDQQEKAWVVETLVANADRALKPLQRYMKNASSLGYPLQAMERMADKNQALKIIDELLASEEPGYTREPSKRIDIIEWLAEWEEHDNDTLFERIGPYLADYDENVRFKAIEALSVRPSSKMAPPMLAALLREEEESARIKRRIAEVLAEQKLPLGDHKKAVSELLPGVLTDFKLHRDKLEKKA